MKFLAYVHAYVPWHGAGAETTLHDMMVALVKRGHECRVLLSRSDSDFEINQDYWIDGVEVIAYDGTSTQPFAYWDEADCLITHLDATERVCAAQHLHEKPIVQVIHNTMLQTTGYLAMGTELAVFNTEWVKDYHESALKEVVVPIVTVGMIEWKERQQSHWNSVVLHPPVHSANYITDGPKDCITLINLWPGGTYGPTHTGKGPEQFYELAEMFPQYKFLGVKGGYGDQDIRELPNVEFMENQKDPREIYRRTKVLLMPSRYESFGRVAIEAAASGIPTIAHPTPGLVECLGTDGLFADRDRIVEWKQWLGQLMTDSDFYEVESIAARERANYWDKTIPAELETFCDSIEEVARKGL